MVISSPVEIGRITGNEAIKQLQASCKHTDVWSAGLCRIIAEKNDLMNYMPSLRITLR